jgi:F-type H+-transporting ATPase subunit a
MLTSGIFAITLLGLVPLFVGFFICVLEMGVAVIQAYVFCLLTVIYLSEGIHLH